MCGKVIHRQGSHHFNSNHYNDIIMSAMASRITGVPIICSAVCSGADQRKKKQNSASLAFVKGITGGQWIPFTKGQLRVTLRWRHNDHAGVSNHQPRGCLLNRLFRRKSKKTSKLRVTGLCAGNSPGTGEFPAQMASYAENVSIWWRHHEMFPFDVVIMQMFFTHHCRVGIRR